MTNESTTYRFKRFDYIYMFIIVIYMGQATEETTRMVGNISGNPIPFLIPIVLTLILWSKKNVKLSRKFTYFVSIYLIWATLSVIKIGIHTTTEYSFHFFMIYAMIVAYIQVRVYSKNIVSLYETVIVWIAKIDLSLWLINHFITPLNSFFTQFPNTYFGHNFLYIYEFSTNSWRNAGCAWEPGRFAVMLILAIFCNLTLNGIKFKKNPNIWWLLIVLATTMSTTGYCTAIALYAVWLIKKFNVFAVIKLIAVFGPIVFGLSQLEFMNEKITSKIEDSTNLSRLDEQFRWNKKDKGSGVYVGSLDRFESMVFEWINFKEEPLLGYGRNFTNSYFHKHYSSNFALANGFMKVFSMYGLFLGALFYIILYQSSKQLAKQFENGAPLGMLVALAMSSISYVILSVPIFTTFWLYSISVTKHENVIKYTKIKLLNV